MNQREVAINCKHYQGDIPCKYHKSEGAVCVCPHYEPQYLRILIIKLGACGDVIRTTPLLRKLKGIHPDSEITWITDFPEVLPRNVIDQILPYSLSAVSRLEADHFDVIYSLDKDKRGCALAEKIVAGEKRGFGLRQGKAFPLSASAHTKWLTGLDDKLNRLNRLSYPQEIFEIAGFRFAGEKYLMYRPKPFVSVDFFGEKGKNKKLLGFNTGVGKRWKTRLWPIEKWALLGHRLIAEDFNILLLGGKAEEVRNKRIYEQIKGYLEKEGKQIEERVIYPPPSTLRVYFRRVGACDLLITCVTMGMHVAIAYEKPVVLLNNIFNRREFELYGRGIILEPNVPCLGCYSATCNRNCMAKVRIEEVASAVMKLLRR